MADERLVLRSKRPSGMGVLGLLLEAVTLPKAQR
jgi:hypothetical protein